MQLTANNFFDIGLICSERDLRQKDPLSLYLFFYALKACLLCSHMSRQQASCMVVVLLGLVLVLSTNYLPILLSSESDKVC